MALPNPAYNAAPADFLGGGFRSSQTLSYRGQPINIDTPFPQLKRVRSFIFQHRTFLTGFVLSTAISNFGLQILQVVICSNQEDVLNIESAKDVLCVHNMTTGQAVLNLVSPVSYSGRNCREFSEKQGLSIYINQQGPGTATGIITFSFDYRYITLVNK